MSKRENLPALLRVLVLVDLFAALSAIGGGVALALEPDGRLIQMPVSILEKSPFSNFLIPGLILAVAVGGSSLIAGIAHITRARLAGQLSLLAGFIMMGWIGVQVGMLREFHFLQPTYFAVGFLQVTLVILALSRAGKR